MVSDCCPCVISAVFYPDKLTGQQSMQLRKQHNEYNARQLFIYFFNTPPGNICGSWHKRRILLAVTEHYWQEPGPGGCASCVSARAGTFGFDFRPSLVQLLRNIDRFEGKHWYFNMSVIDLAFDSYWRQRDAEPHENLDQTDDEEEEYDFPDEAMRINDRIALQLEDEGVFDREVQSSGGFDYEFIDKVLDSQKCAVCLLPMRDAVQTRCGHRFCYTCLAKTLRYQRRVRIMCLWKLSSLLCSPWLCLRCILIVHVHVVLTLHIIFFHMKDHGV